jgi:hypothetical protein
MLNPDIESETTAVCRTTSGGALTLQKFCRFRACSVTPVSEPAPAKLHVAWVQFENAHFTKLKGLFGSENLGL